MKKKYVIWLLVAAVLSGLWFWRYTTMNAYYDSLNRVVEKEYLSGEYVPFEDDYISGEDTLDGYFVRVDGFELLEFEELCSRTGMTGEGIYSPPERVVLVTVTLKNETNAEDAVPLTSLVLHGIDSVVGLNWDLMADLNPKLEGNSRVRLREGQEFQVVLPYNLRKNLFSSYTWNHMENYDWFLRITVWPTEKDIKIQ